MTISLELCLGGNNSSTIENNLVIATSGLAIKNSVIEFNRQDTLNNLSILDIMRSPESFSANLITFKQNISNPSGIKYKLESKPNSVIGFIDWESAMPCPHDLSMTDLWVSKYGYHKGLYAYSEALKTIVEIAESEIKRHRPQFIVKLFGAGQLHHACFLPTVPEHQFLLSKYSELFLNYNSPFKWLTKYFTQHFYVPNKYFTSFMLTDWITLGIQYFKKNLIGPCFYLLCGKYSNESGWVDANIIQSGVSMLKQHALENDTAIIWGNTTQDATEIAVPLIKSRFFEKKSNNIGL